MCVHCMVVECTRHVISICSLPKTADLRIYLLPPHSHTLTHTQIEAGGCLRAKYIYIYIGQHLFVNRNKFEMDNEQSSWWIHRTKWTQWTKDSEECSIGLFFFRERETIKCCDIHSIEFVTECQYNEFMNASVFVFVCGPIAETRTTYP